MIVVCSDTHGRDGHRLADQVAEDVADAELVIHAGDFVTEAALAAFEDAAEELVAVHGNVDEDAVRDRLPTERTLTIDDVRIAIVHTVDGGAAGLATFGRAHDADLVVFGHSHRPGYEWTGELGLLNPGSHAEPRQFRPGYATLEIDGGVVSGALREPDGGTVERFEVGERTDDG